MAGELIVDFAQTPDGLTYDQMSSDMLTLLALNGDMAALDVLLASDELRSMEECVCTRACGYSISETCECGCRGTNHGSLRHGTHNQKSHGRKKGQTISTGESQQLSEMVSKPDGGYTYDTNEARFVTKGFAVSPYLERSEVVAVADATPQRISEYAEKNSDVLKEPNHMLGGWHNPDDGKVYLDVSIVEKNVDAAIATAKKHNQIAIYDLEGGKTIDTGGSGR